MHSHLGCWTYCYSFCPNLITKFHNILTYLTLDFKVLIQKKCWQYIKLKVQSLISEYMRRTIRKRTFTDEVRICLFTTWYVRVEHLFCCYRIYMIQFHMISLWTLYRITRGHPRLTICGAMFFFIWTTHQTFILSVKYLFCFYRIQVHMISLCIHYYIHYYYTEASLNFLQKNKSSVWFDLAILGL